MHFVFLSFSRLERLILDYTQYSFMGHPYLVLHHFTAICHLLRGNFGGCGWEGSQWCTPEDGEQLFQWKTLFDY